GEPPPRRLLPRAALGRVSGMGLDHGRRRAGDRHAAPLRLGHGSQRSHPPGAPEGRGEHHLPLGAFDGLPAARARCGADAGADEGGGRTAAPPARRARGPLRGGHGAAGRRRAPARVAAILAAPMIVVAANPYSGASDNRRRVEALARELAALGEHPCVVWGARERAAMLGDRAAMTGSTLRRGRRASYVAPLAASLFTYRHPPVRVVAGEAAASGAYCVVANAPAYALDLPLAPGARADDGALDWVVFERGGLAALA